MLDLRRGYWLAIVFGVLGYLSAGQGEYQMISLLIGIAVTVIYCDLAAAWFPGWWEHEPVGHALAFIPAIAVGAMLPHRKYGVDGCLITGLCRLLRRERHSTRRFLCRRFS